MIGMAIATAAIIATLSSTIASSKFQSGTLTFSEAESGAENAYLRLLRESLLQRRNYDYKRRNRNCHRFRINQYYH
jgi:hypothetical protein